MECGLAYFVVTGVSTHSCLVGTNSTAHSGGPGMYGVAGVTRHGAGWIRVGAELDAIGTAVRLPADHMWPKVVWLTGILYTDITIA